MQQRPSPKDAPDEAPSRAPLDSASCIVCSQRAWRPHYAGLVRCAACGFVRADMQLSEEELRAIYSEKYFQGEEYADYLSEADVHRRNAAARFHELTKSAGKLESLFEVGCAYGLWLEYLARKGVRCAGIDICETATQYARCELGQQAAAGDFLALPLEAGEYSAFCMWDTIEHLPAPEQFVSRIYSLLPHGGWFFATTGDIGSRLARMRGPRWRMIHPPTHLHYFSAETMRRFLTRIGFQVERLSSVPCYRNLRSVLANMQVLSGATMRRMARLSSRIIPDTLQKHLGAWINLGDIMLVCARKP